MLISTAYTQPEVVEACRREWWQILLFVNNYLPGDCLPQSWCAA